MKKILIVDDETDILNVVSLILKSKGYKVYTHSTGIGVPDLVQKINPDLILLDIRLPGKSGTEICKELKNINQRPHILLFSAHANEGEAFKACNADGFIQKPFDRKNLLTTISSQIS